MYSLRFSYWINVFNLVLLDINKIFVDNFVENRLCRFQNRLGWVWKKFPECRMDFMIELLLLRRWKNIYRTFNLDLG